MRSGCQKSLIVLADRGFQLKEEFAAVGAILEVPAFTKGKKRMSNRLQELSHPHLFPTGKFGYKIERDIKLSPAKYFDQRLLNYSEKFASDSD